MPWFVKIERGIVPKETFDRFVPAHRDYVQRLREGGRLAQSGYWGQRGGGMLLFWADSREEAQTLVEQDPLILNHCVEYELREWRLIDPAAPFTES
ncbi:MAG: YciI family protein [Cyanobacteriota bacterium]|jgi:uncharacterized protein YciI